MKTSDFYYDLPPELIAQTPLEKRDESRLLCLDKATGEWSHHHFYELPDFLRAGDCLILNNSRVLPARLLGRRLPGGGACEVLLLQDKGYIKLKDGAGITATVTDIAENPHNITFREIEAAQLPNSLKDLDYAVINSNYALPANLNPVKDALLTENSTSAYSNILAVKEGQQNTDKVKALVAALESKKVADFIAQEYDGAVISVVENPGDGYDSSVDYDALKGTTVSVAASPTPHAEVLAVAKEILAEKDITLNIVEFTDYVQPNNVVESGEVDANYFQHLPYLEDFNAQNNTHVVSVAAIHVEPMSLYGGKQTTLDALNK